MTNTYKASNRSTNELLGYPPDARLLIVNADDFGMCHVVNRAVFGVLQAGLVHSTTLMVPCPWALQAMHFIVEHSETSFGVHLTVIGDGDVYRWRPVTAAEKVPSLVDRAGYFYSFAQMAWFLSQVRLRELETEFRAQIETVLAAGLRPTHLDWHSLRIGGREDVLALLFRLAQEYGMALRVLGRGFTAKLQGLGFPTNDYDFLDSYGLDPARKATLYAQMLHELPPGLSEWAIHPGLDSPELLAIEPDGRHSRQADYDFWVSPEAKRIIAEEGVALLSYRPLQEIWRES
ncbi:MAG: polysaccharide deacetylase family protein [Chloroflexota bacterium]